MNKLKQRIVPSRLSMQILLYFLIASAAAVSLYFSLDYCSNAVISEHFSNAKAISNQTEQELESFRYYVASEGLSTGDTATINDWIYSEKYVLMNIYKDDYLVYSSNYPDYFKESYGHAYKFNADGFMPSYHRLYDVTFSDGTAQVGIYLLAASKIYDAVQIIEMVLAFLCFVVIFLTLFSSKFRYITRLQNELKIIESGNLGLPVTIKGNDEISFLARGIDEMRKSFLERIKNEKEARRANSELITSISHDLRTPLTILIGNLDVIADRKYKTEEQLSRYIDSCRKKAYQLKELSDKLFEYFLVFGSEYREPKLERVDCGPFLTQLIGDYALSLEDKGFTVSVDSSIDKCCIEASIIAVRRVFDNLFSNIVKYAQPASPVGISISRKGGDLTVAIKNIVGEYAAKTKGTNIGLATCEKIMAQHGGTFSVSKDEHIFCASVSFPIKEPLIQTLPCGPGYFCYAFMNAA